MKELIPKFNPKTDCSLLVTKASRKDKEIHVFKKVERIGV
jgi:hypothetical protein